MANNTQINTNSSSGDIISDDQITTLNGVGIATNEKVQRMKIAYGVPASATDVNLTTPFPVTTPNVLGNGTFTSVDAVVSAPIGDGTLINGTSTSGSIVALAIPSNMSAWIIMLKVYTTGTVYSEASPNSTNGTDGDWVEIKGRKTGTATGIESVGYAFTSSGIYRGNSAGFTWFRLRYLGTFTAGMTALISLSQATGAVFLNSGLVASGSVIGKVGFDQTTDGTTNAVRLLSETTKIIGTVNVGGTASTDPSDRAARLLGVITSANLDVALSTRLKPADTLTAVALISDTRQTVAANLNMTEASSASILARTPALGQVSAAVSTPVVQNIETAAGSITTQNLVPAGVATAGSAVEISLAGSSTLTTQTTGTFTGPLNLQVTVDGVNWVTVGGTPFINANTGIFLSAITSTIQSCFQSEVTGFLKARITALGAMTGTVTVTIRASANTSIICLDTALPPGFNTIGAVNIAASQTLANVTTVATVSLNSDVRQSVAANFNATVTQQVITKGNQGTNGITTQDLKDAGRNQVHYYTLIPVLSTSTDTLQLLTGTKGAATVTATATPAVVTTGKTFRVTRLAATYIATAVSGYGIVRLRYTIGGVVTIAGNIAATLVIGSSAPTTANSTASEEATLDEGWEFSAGTGVGVSVQGFAAVTPTAVGYVLVSLTGYEY